MAKKVLTNLDLASNQLLNARLQQVSGNPSTLSESLFWYNSTTKKPMFYNGTDVKNFGIEYSPGTGISIDNSNNTIAIDTTVVAQKTDLPTFSTGLTDTSGTITVTDYDKLVKNTATGTNSLSILGTPTSSGGAMNIGMYSEATNATAGIAIGSGAKVKIDSGIQLGFGTNNAFSGLQVYSFPLLDGTTGLIPDDRISSNIARTSAIPTTVAQLSDSGNYALKSDLTAVYKAAGTVASASDLPTLSASVLGNVYNVTASFTSTSDFVEGSGKTIQVGNDIAVVDVGTGSSHSYKFSVMGDFVDLSGYQQTSTAVTHTASTAVGSATKGVYVASDGTATAMTYSLNKDVPSNAVFTDTTYSFDTGSTNGTIKVTPSGGSASDIAVKGLGTAAYTASTDYATAAQGTKADNSAQRYNTTNPALTASGGLCTWTVTHNLGRQFVQVKVYETSTGEEVITDVICTSTTVATVKINSSTNITSGTYTVVVQG